MCSINKDKSECNFEIKYHKKNLAQDKNGFCILHSRDLAWKKESNIEGLILSIVNDYVQSKDLRNIDFEGAVFGPSINYLLSLDFKKKNLILDDCLIYADISVESQSYEGTLSLKNCLIKGKVSFSETSFNGIDLTGITIEGNFFLTKVESKSYFFLDESNIHGGIIAGSTLFNHVFSMNEAKVNSDTEMLRHTHFNSCTFRNQADFIKTHFKKAFVITHCTILDRMYFDRTVFECDLYSPIYGSVHFSYLKIDSTGALQFMGTDEAKIFDVASVVIFEHNEIDGELGFENCNLQKVLDRYREDLVKESKKVGSKVFIGRGCLKYKNQSPERTVFINVDNQNLVLDLCNTFSKFFSKSRGYNLGLEITERTSKIIKYFYFSDEPISYEDFIENLSDSELNMWSLVRIDKQSINSNVEVDSSLPNKIINTTDTIIDLASVILKIASRIPLLKLSKTEIDNILNSSNITGRKIVDTSSISVMNINQTILLGIGNKQTTKLK